MKTQLVFTACLIMFGFLGLTLFKSWTHLDRVISPHQRTVVAPENLESVKSKIYKDQRNTLSRLLNHVKRELSMLSCDHIALKQSLEQPSTDVSTNGGWCKQSSRSNSGSHAFDKSLAYALAQLLQNKEVASFGDGPGDYKKFMDSIEKIKLYDAYDGAPYGPETSGGAVKFLDLTAPQYGLPVYDWVVSLEVAEHIPAKYEEVYLDNILRHAREGIVLSWAVPGQGGLSHVNEKPLSHVQTKMAAGGFKTDIDASKMLQQGSTLPWLKANVYVYRRMNGSHVIPENA